jgi:hypothetical protein
MAAFAIKPTQRAAPKQETLPKANRRVEKVGTTHVLQKIYDFLASPLVSRLHGQQGLINHYLDSYATALLENFSVNTDFFA